MAKKIIEIKVNGFTHELAADASVSLADILRVDLGLLGVKKGCGRGQCGCCTVLMDGRVVSSCLVLAVEAHHREVVTVEGLDSESPKIRAVARQLIDSGAAAEGFGATGLFVTAVDVAQKGVTDDAEVAVGLSGNCLTGCGYDQAIEAVKAASKEG